MSFKSFMKPSIQDTRTADLVLARFQLHQYEATLSHATHMVSYLQETIQRLERQIQQAVFQKPEPQGAIQRLKQQIEEES